MSVLGKTQQDVVNVLRAIDTGSVVNLCVSRHVEHLPRKLVRYPCDIAMKLQEKMTGCNVHSSVL